MVDPTHNTMRLNLGDFDSAQNEIPPPQQQLISNVNPWLKEKATGYRVVVGNFLLEIVMKRNYDCAGYSKPRFNASRIISKLAFGVTCR